MSRQSYERPGVVPVFAVVSPDFPPSDERTFDSIRIDETFELERAFTRDDVLAYASLCGDFSPLHVDSEYARTTEFGACVVHGMLLASLFSTLVGMRVPGRPALYLGQDLVFRRPVFIGETVCAIAKVTGRSEATRSLTLATEIRTADNRVAVSGSAKVKVRGATGAVAVASPTQVPASSTPQRGVAIVTGASRGIGAEIARHLSTRGMAVAVNYLRSADRAAGVANEIRSAGGTAIAIGADVRDDAQAARLVERCVGELGVPSVLVNAAIGELSLRAATELRWQDFVAQLDYHAKAVLRLCQLVHPLMKQRGGGSIVNLASQVVAGVPPTQMADYVTAKHALEGLSKALAAEWAGDGIRVNIVSPGLTRTDLTQFHHERVFKAEALRTPLRRLATPDDIARAVGYLADEDGAFLTGTNLFVTGGQVML